MPELRVERACRPALAAQLSTQTPLNSLQAFTLLEVIIACSIFFIVAFAILQMVTSGLAAAKALQQREPDAGMLAATLSLTNMLEEGVESGDFQDVAGDLYRDYRWSREINQVGSNGLFQVDFVIYSNAPRKRGASESRMSLLMFRPASKPGRNFGTGR
jgi:hypothetical protein